MASRPARPAAPKPALLLVIAALLGFACGSEASQATPTSQPETASPVESASPRWSSTFYPYALTLPPSWVAHGAVGDEDLFESADGTFSLKVGSGRPESGQTVADRVRINRVDAFARCETDPERDREVSVGGEPGIMWSFRCGTVPGIAANTIHDGVGYRLTLRGTDEVADQLEETLVEILSGFVFTQ